MSRLLGFGPWTRQPQIAVGVDRSNPLATRLAFAYNGATIFDHARRVRPTAYPADSYMWGAGVVDGAAGTEYGDFIGPQQEGTDVAGMRINFQGYPLAGPNITLFARALVDSNFGNGGFLFAFADENNDRGVELGIGASNIEVWSADASTTWQQTSGPAYADNDIINIVAVVSAGQPVKVYTSLDQTVYSSASNFSNDNAAGSAMCIGAYNTSGNGCLLGTVACALMWDRALSEREARAVMANPWQVFAPLRRNIGVPGQAAVTLQGSPGQWDKTLLIDGWFGEVAGIKGWYAVDFMTPAAPGGTVLKYWTGAAWVAKPLKRWNGSTWVAATLKRWNGSAWV